MPFLKTPSSLRENTGNSYLSKAAILSPSFSLPANFLKEWLTFLASIDFPPTCPTPLQGGFCLHHSTGTVLFKVTSGLLHVQSSDLFLSV